MLSGKDDAQMGLLDRLCDTWSQQTLFCAVSIPGQFLPRTLWRLGCVAVLAPTVALFFPGLGFKCSKVFYLHSVCALSNPDMGKSALTDFVLIVGPAWSFSWDTIVSEIFAVQVLDTLHKNVKYVPSCSLFFFFPFSSCSMQLPPWNFVEIGLNYKMLVSVQHLHLACLVIMLPLQ